MHHAIYTECADNHESGRPSLAMRANKLICAVVCCDAVHAVCPLRYTLELTQEGREKDQYKSESRSSSNYNYNNGGSNYAGGGGGYYSASSSYGGSGTGSSSDFGSLFSLIAGTCKLYAAPAYRPACLSHQRVLVCSMRRLGWRCVCVPAKCLPSFTDGVLM